jgi:hypothetical protein
MELYDRALHLEGRFRAAGRWPVLGEGYWLHSSLSPVTAGLPTLSFSSCCRPAAPCSPPSSPQTEQVVADAIRTAFHPTKAGFSGLIDCLLVDCQRLLKGPRVDCPAVAPGSAFLGLTTLQAQFILINWSDN